MAIGMIFFAWYAIGVAGKIWGELIGQVNDALHLQPQFIIEQKLTHVGKPVALVLVAVDVCVLAPIAEEILFRSGLYRLLKGRLSWTAAAGISAARVLDHLGFPRRG